jgi:biotin operon repressor/ribosomal protein L29
MGLLDFLQWKRHWQAMDNALSQSFGRLKNETSLIFSWLHYFREKDRIHDDRYLYAQQQLEKRGSQIDRLREEMMSVKAEMLALRMSQTSSGHARTQEGTIKGQLRDMSPAENKPKIAQKTSFFDKTQLRGSELELMQMLYHSDRPLSYNEIAKRLSKSEKSIRNLVYELRRKGVDVKAQPIGVREKGFYMTAQTKIAVSGR